ncbi:MAG: UDP-2-acetamido-2-deoxy-3-oxo-D-glucuronate aminotransferase [Pseudomonadota bacterium]|jgi:dTDP-4-amino-4,6-dideoxygalactose transaminase
MRQIPFFPWAGLFDEHGEEYVAIVRECLTRGAFILQRDIDEFERALESYLGVKHAIAVSDATNAMLLGLRALDLEPGYEAILPSHCFVAAAQSIHFSGGVPVPVELGDDWMVDASAMEAAITPRTKVLMPVQVNGRTADMDAILDIAARHGLIVVEDSAQALGARYKGRATGTIGAWGCYSFYPSKTLGTFGDAGALVTNDDRIAETVRRMRNHGANAEKTIEADNTIWGTNCRMDNLHAAILKFKLGQYPDAIARRRAIAAQYHAAFRDIPQLVLPPAPDDDPDWFDVYQNYELMADRRDDLREHLRQNGVGTIIQWGGLALHHMHGLGFKQKLPGTDAFFARCLLLPMQHLMDDDDVDHVCELVRAFYRA